MDIRLDVSIIRIEDNRLYLSFISFFITIFFFIYFLIFRLKFRG